VFQSFWFQLCLFSDQRCSAFISGKVFKIFIAKNAKVAKKQSAISSQQLAKARRALLAQRPEGLLHPVGSSIGTTRGGGTTQN